MSQVGAGLFHAGDVSFLSTFATMPGSRPGSKGSKRDSRPNSRDRATPRDAEPDPDPEAPLPTHPLTLSFSFDMAEVTEPLPEPPGEGEEPPAEEEEKPPWQPLAGTYFSFTLPAEAGTTAEGEPVTFDLAHPLSGEGAPEASSAELVVSEALIRWLVVEAQGHLPLVLRRRGVDGAEDADVCPLPMDLGPLIFRKDGKDSASARFRAAGAPSSAAEELAPLPVEAAELATSVAVTVASDVPLLTPELLYALNPLSVTLVRADGLPSAYSGTPYRRPYEELSERCAPVTVNWSLLGTEYTSSPQPHGESLLYRERKLLLAGSRVIEPAELARQLREKGLRLELHDRDPLPPPEPPPPEPTEGEEGAEPPAPAEPEAEGEEGEEGAEVVEEEPDSSQHPPFGVTTKSLAELIPRRSTDAAPLYQPRGIPVRAQRRLMLELDVQPCERPKKRPEPEEAAAEYYAGAYVEHGTTVSVTLELAAPLRAERKPKPRAELQRIVTMIRYTDTPMMHALLGVAKAANDAIGMNSASKWEEYKEAAREDLDLITGMQLVDGETRLFFFEGLAATDDNAMGRLGKILERQVPNSSTAFTLMNTQITFPERLYNTFEMPMKLIKIRAPLPALLIRPDIYQYLRVSEGCRDALLCLGSLLGSQTLRLAFKATAFPNWEHMLQLEKKFGGVQLVADREGVTNDDDEDDAYDLATGAPAAAGGRAHRHRAAPRKDQTDSENELWYRSLKERAEQEPVNWLAKNIADLPRPPTPQPLPAWYLDAIPKITGPVYMYSGQRLNQTDVQKEALRLAIEKLHREQGVQRTYNRNFLWADSVGDREPRKPTREAIAAGTLKIDPHLTPWDLKQPIVANKDGTRSSYRILQPSDYRDAELNEPWDEIAVRNSRKPVERDTNPPPNATKHPKRWNPNPSPSGRRRRDRSRGLVHCRRARPCARARGHQMSRAQRGETRACVEHAKGDARMRPARARACTSAATSAARACT